MTEPFDFEELVAGIDLDLLTGAYRSRAACHVRTRLGGRAWANLERYHDMYDNSHFEAAGLPAARDEWDNRRKREDA